jgi:hypothetical protein
MITTTRKVLLTVLIIGSAAVVLAWTSIHPRDDREWIPEQAVLPIAEIRGNTVRIRNVRNFTYTGRTKFTPNYDDRTYDLDKLTSVWYVLTPFSMKWRGPAHSFVSFGFSDSQFVSISVEARREPGETYDAIKGIFKRFEVIYVVGDERDMIGQRAAFKTESVYLYPVNTTPERMREMFLSMLNRANKLRTEPEFYNTITNNCTSNVVAHVNQIVPNAVPSGFKTIMPGYTDEVALKLGLISSNVDIEQTRQRYLVNPRVEKYMKDPAFSFRIREAP